MVNMFEAGTAEKIRVGYYRLLTMTLINRAEIEHREIELLQGHGRC
jgi:hypothetical protein